MILYTDYDLRVIPVMGDSDWGQIDRVQNLDKTGTINKIRVEEVGNEDVVGYIDQAPAVTYRLTQLEYGSLSFFEKLANKKNQNSLDLGDFKTSAFDICAYLTNDDGTFIGTLWLPKLRLSGFSITIGDPQGLIERSFDFVGEDWIRWQGNNKYLIYKEDTVESADLESDNSVHITVDDPDAVEDPDNSGTYILRVVRVRSGTATELTAGTDYSFETHAGGDILIVESCQANDVIKYWYTASSYIGGSTPFTANTSDLEGIHANSATITIQSGTQIYKLQSVTIDVRFDRQDLFEIGNSEVVQRGIRNKTVTITLGRLYEDATIEELLREKTPADDYGKLDIRKFGSDFKLKVKLYEDSDKNTFKIGYCADNLAPSEIGGGVSVDNYTEARNTLAGEELVISDDLTTFNAL